MHNAKTIIKSHIADLEREATELATALEKQIEQRLQAEQEREQAHTERNTANAEKEKAEAALDEADKRWEETLKTCSQAERDLDQVMKDRDRFESALQKTHIALGGDGEWSWTQRNPPESGDLSVDVPVLAGMVLGALEAMKQRWEEEIERAEKAEAACAELRRSVITCKT